jgi:hypothetical protein
MDAFEIYWGVSEKWFAIIALFYCTMTMLIFGADALHNAAMVMVILFLTLGTALLVGSLGWQVLVIPSLIVILATLVLILRLRG